MAKTKIKWKNLISHLVKFLSYLYNHFFHDWRSSFQEAIINISCAITTVTIAKYVWVEVMIWNVAPPAFRYPVILLIVSYCHRKPFFIATLNSSPNKYCLYLYSTVMKSSISFVQVFKHMWNLFIAHLYSRNFYKSVVHFNVDDINNSYENSIVYKFPMIFLPTIPSMNVENQY